MTNDVYHSLLKLLTGLATAAFIAWKLTVNKVIDTTAPHAIKKTAGPMSIR